jgi:outer membrane protein OmpA-like peptidoglycan-associated protein
MNRNSKKTKRRYWRRTMSSGKWSPWGVAPLVGLGMLFLFGALFMAPRIEAEVRDQVALRVDGSGLFAMGIRGDGQGVTITTPADAQKALYLEALARSTQCKTWAGELACPTTVSILLIESQQAPALLDDQPQADDEQRSGSSLPISAEVSTPGGVDAGSSIGIQQCNSDFEAVLSSASIRFRTGSASIDTGNDELLDRLADVARNCHGQLTVQGHTDSQGDADANQALSLSRATAVSDALAGRGIEADRITSTGFGESQPIADNGTSAGRAKNRRIVITIE